MVCLPQAPLQNGETHKINSTSGKIVENLIKMDINTPVLPRAHWQLQHLAGGDIILHRPLFSPNGDFLFVNTGKHILVYSTTSGVLAHKLTGAKTSLISMEIDPLEDKLLDACTEQGEFIRWDWRKGTIVHTIALRIAEIGIKLSTFNTLNFYNSAGHVCAFVTYSKMRGPINWCVVSTTSGEKLEVNCKLKLLPSTPLVAVNNKQYKLIALCQQQYIHFIDYESWKSIRLFNAHKVPITVVTMHPMEELVATGDIKGRVFLWRQYFSTDTVVTVLYHWHHTPVTSIAFSGSGSSFYSGGYEGTLVKWNVQHTEMRSFLPRMPATIRQIAVSGENSQIAVCTADNAIEIIGTDSKIKTTLQEFTYVPDDKTGRSKFPVGLCFNPRTHTLVLNGRSGHLQFYSVYTKNLLFNMDIANQNPLSIESEKILYDIAVTKAAFHIDWMATGEVFNDMQHRPELRLKFWKYEDETQSYKLHTSIEQPHESGFTALKFSDSNDVENLLCASVGKDNVIKIWSLEESDSIYKSRKVWFCIAETSYKNYPIDFIAFSDEGSVLAAGYGNTLCIYQADNLSLKTALSCADSSGFVKKVQLIMSEKVSPNADQKYRQRSRKIIMLLRQYFSDGNESVFKEISNTLSTREEILEPSYMKVLSEHDKKNLHQEILSLRELDLFQKILLFHKLGIRCKLQPYLAPRFIDYLRDTVLESSIKRRVKELHKQLNRLPKRTYYKAKYRALKYMTRHSIPANAVNNLMPILSTLCLSENTVMRHGKRQGVEEQSGEEEMKPSLDSDEEMPRLTSDITHIQFLNGELAYLVVACTVNRVLVWNLLDLRVKQVLKVTVQHMVLDSCTNLIALYTNTNSLYIFQPKFSVIIYEHHNLPDIYGMIWIPRRIPRQSSIDVDWQAHSIIYFLTKQQELVYLATSKDLRLEEERTPAVLNNKLYTNEYINYTTFGAYANQHIKDKDNKTPFQKYDPIIAGDAIRIGVESLTAMSVHTMSPLSLLCENFVQSMMISTITPKGIEATPTIESVKVNGIADHTDTEDDANAGGDTPSDTKALKLRHCMLKTETLIYVNSDAENDVDEKRLKNLIKLRFELP